VDSIERQYDNSAIAMAIAMAMAAMAIQLIRLYDNFGQITFFDQRDRWHGNLSDPAISFLLADLAFVLFKI
jgi:hypothetical protein